MKPQHLVPLFILALTWPGYASAGFGPSQKGDCGCSHVQKVAQKSAPCKSCGVAQKHTQKSSKSSCGCAQKGHAQKGHYQKAPIVAQKHGVVQKHCVAQKGVVQKGVVQKGVVQKGIVQKGVVQKHGVAQKSKGGCSTCCLSVIPAVLNGVDEIVTNTVGHMAAMFACNTCGGSKSKSKGCVSCGGSSKVGLPGIPPNPFEDDELQAPPVPSTEARIRIQRRPVHRHVMHTTAAPVVRTEPRVLTISVMQPIKPSKPPVAPVIRTVSNDEPTSRAPYNPLRGK